MSKTSLTIVSYSVVFLLCLRHGLGLPDSDGDTRTPTLCAYVYHDVVKEMKSSPMPSKASEDVVEVEGRHDSMQGMVFADNKTIRCAKATDFCYTLWIEDNVNSTVAPKMTTLLAQGCWESSGEYDCGRTECVSVGRVMKAMNNTKFCCCTGDMCNSNMTVSDELIAPQSSDRMLSTVSRPSMPSVEQASRDRETLYTALASLACAIGLCFVTFFAYRRWVRLRKPSPDAVHLVESGHGGVSSSPAFDLENLKLHEVVGRGRYGTVWRASLNDTNVAVKIFPSQHRHCFLNERDIYCLPFMEHLALLRYLGSEERVTVDGRPEYHLVVSYAPLGCLQEYLRANVTDWSTLCRMSQSIATGLAHLHNDICKGNLSKPCITHRDLNSRNVLVNADLSCVLCDLGFAMKIAGSRYYNQGGEEQHAETTSLTDVGTLRYMAPEVLEGAVNLRDCESSLKQIDVYALGLILWEVATRCSDLYQGLEVPEYRMPFEAEIGSHPTFEQMQVLISRNKARPLFPDVWKDTNQAVRLLKETIEDCWDQDAEARLTSLCVEERLQELPVLWERHRASFGASGVSPTVNPTCCQTTTVACRQPAPHDCDDVLAANCCRLAEVTSGCEGSTSEATAETTVTVSPPAIGGAEPEPQLSKNANNRYFSRAPLPLQPHQGRNPCLERNMMEPLEEMSISGNTLLGKGVRGGKNLMSVDRDVEGLFDAVGAIDAVESNTLVNHDHLGGLSNRICNPIPYVQNAVCKATVTPASAPGFGGTHHHPRPKRLNVPGNGWHHQPHVGATSGVAAKEAGASGGSSGGGVLRSLFEWARRRKAKSTGGQQDQEDCEGAEEEDNGDEDFEEDAARASVQTKVCLMPGRRRGGDSVVRTVVDDAAPSGRCARDDSDNHRQRRPNTLPLRGIAAPRQQAGSVAHEYSKVHTAEPGYCSVDNGGDDGGGGSASKISQRVKTPYELIKSGRFSLYDDRMMSSSSPSQETIKGVKDKNVYSISVPVDMDTLCTQQAEGFIRQYCAMDGERSDGSAESPPNRHRRSRHLHNPPPLPPPRSRSDAADAQAMSKLNGGVSHTAIYQISCL